jgi:hypothetical protein
LVQRIVYQNFVLPGESERDVDYNAGAVTERVRMELRRSGPIGFIWWRQRPVYAEREGSWEASFRLGTSPTLPDKFWRLISKTAGNVGHLRG